MILIEGFRNSGIEKLRNWEIEKLGDLKFDGLVKSHFFRFPVIPAKAGHVVKH
jgi:hypothetical protein